MTTIACVWKKTMLLFLLKLDVKKEQVEVLIFDIGKL